MMNFNEKYNHHKFLEFLNDFLPEDFAQKEEDIVIKKERYKEISQARILGYSESLDVHVLEMDHSREKDPRITIATDAFKILADHWIHKALVIFKNDDSDNYRLSYLTISLDLNDKNKAIKKYSNARRYSFYLGTNSKVRTPEQQLIKKGRVKDADDLLLRFSVEVVNKEFYKEIAELYTKLVGGTRLEERQKKKFEALLSLPNVESGSLIANEFTVRLIGRIIFCWFLREKKSKNGLPLVPNTVLSLESLKLHSNYYHTMLEPLFFEVLNKVKISRKDDFQKEPFGQIPYLNGGLFSPQNDDYYSSDPTVQVINQNIVTVPDSWLQELFELLELYNFTVDENTSIDIDLSIDPEMLGRIFENLLAEINPETGESARKSTGSYYTPREIVEYMVDESLYQYLRNKTAINEEKIHSLISYDLNDDKEYPLSHNEEERVIEALSQIKILDPACGSGAFPIGALQKIIFMLQRIDPDAQVWFKLQLEGAAPEIKKVVEREFEHRNFDYIRKLGIIRESIYGVDIQPIATEIARLRCFLTLIVDERADDNEPNRGVEPLPNLDFKFVTANTLVGLPSSQSNNQIGLFEDQEGIKQLKEVRDAYFNSSGAEREQLKFKFVQVQNKMFQRMVQEHTPADLTQKLSSWDPFGHDAATWFDMDWMFGIKDGFDIVIANPPYISHDKIDNKEYLKKNYKTFEAFADVYCYFLELAVRLQNESGVLCFITSNSYLRADYGKPLRKLINQENHIKALINIDDFQLFGSAIVNTSILLSQKFTKKENFQDKAKIVNKSFLNVNNFNEFINSNYFYYNQSDFNNMSWNLITPEKLQLQQKIKRKGVTLEDLHTKIRLGLATGANEAFIINKSKRDEFINANPKNAEIIKPILRGKDIYRYGYQHADLYIILAKNGINIKSDYPQIYNYLDSFGSSFKTRGAQGQNWWNLRACAFFEDFKKDKIVWIELNDYGRFALATDEIYLVNSAYFLIPPNGVPIKTLLGLLNSSVIRFYLSTIAETSGMGVFRWINNYVKEFPIPNISPENGNLITKMVNEILVITNNSNYLQDSTKKVQVKRIEEKIDQVVNKLYDLSAEEISLIEHQSN